MSALPSSKKTHLEQHKLILRQLLREPANKTCVDCKTAAHPRWASWNLGCFMCIRCLGIHRSMGTHILKVKSVDLDAWTDEQVALMVQWGNSKCNAYWEAQLPENYIPDGLKIENFIRTKYDRKKWVLLAQIPAPLTLATGTGTGTGSVSVPSTPPASVPNAVASNNVTTTPSNDLLDDEFGLFALHKSSTASRSIPSSSLKSSSAPKVGFPSSSSSSLPRQHQKSHGNISSSHSSTNSGTSTGSSMGSNSLPKLHESRSTPTPPQNNARPDLKKSILSLYLSPSSSALSIAQRSQSPGVPSGGYGGYGGQNLAGNYLGASLSHSSTSTMAGSSSIGSLGHNLGGLNLGNNLGNSGSGPVTQQQQQNTPQSSSGGQTQTWNNEWSDSWSKPALLKSTLDDDLFKNVW